MGKCNLKRLREAAGLSQAELSRASGVSLRMIQGYEAVNAAKKNINAASGMTLFRLANAIGCRMEDLLEHED